MSLADTLSFLLRCAAEMKSLSLACKSGVHGGGAAPRSERKLENTTLGTRGRRGPERVTESAGSRGGNRNRGFLVWR